MRRLLSALLPKADIAQRGGGLFVARRSDSFSPLDLTGDVNMSTAVVADQRVWYLNRWTQLVLGVVAMMAISSPQYTWTLFTGPLNSKLGTTLAELQWTFSLLIILQTWFSPFQAYLVDRFGPKLLISVGAIMSG